MVLVVQGIIGGEPAFKHQHLPLSGQILETRVEHPPERHRVRLTVSGAGLMVASVLLGILLT
jgi:hypothetical protein